MARQAPKTPSILDIGAFGDNTAIQSVMAWSDMFMKIGLEAQRVPMQMLLAWQQSLSESQMNMWDEWNSRYAGGVPIDG